MNIDEMPAGREMNELIAKEIFGWRTANLRPGLWNPKNHDPIHYSCDEPDEVLDYSAGFAAAWELVEYILVHDKRLLQFRAEIAGGGKYQYAKFVDCGDNSAPVYGACASRMPLAICRAALKVARSSQSTKPTRPNLTTAILSSLPSALQGKLGGSK